jgi:tetratricopeptide (TPR) repeat protein
MPKHPRLRFNRIILYLAFCLAVPALCTAQQEVLGTIMGRISVDRKGVVSERILVTLLHRGAPMDSAYTDSEGTFGFHNLGPDAYEVLIDDEHYEAVREQVVIEPFTLNPTVVVNIRLIPKLAAPASASPQRPDGANAHITDAREYSARFAKQVRKEFDKGVAADQEGKKEEAIKHYSKAIMVAPDYYPAHNNLGSDYLSKADFSHARKEFEEVVHLNQSDAEAYFNLSNVCMMSGQLADAQRYLEEGMRRQPDSAFGHFLLGSLDIKIGKFMEAETLLRQTIQLSPAMTQARLQLVNLFLQEGKHSEAADQLRDFVKAFPDSSFTPQARLLLKKLSTPAEDPISR